MRCFDPRFARHSQFRAGNLAATAICAPEARDLRGLRELTPQMTGGQPRFGWSLLSPSRAAHITKANSKTCPPLLCPDQIRVYTDASINGGCKESANSDQCRSA